MPCLAHDDGLVRHRRHIGAAGRARAHHHGDLRDAERGQRRLVVEDAAEVLAVGKHLGLVRQVGAAGVDQIDARQPVLARDLLGAQMLLHRHRIIGAALDGGVVAHDHALAALDAADAGDQAGAVDGVVVHAVARRAATVRETASRDRAAASRARAAAACRAPHGARGRAAGRLAPPRRGAVAAHRRARACARRWRRTPRSRCRYWMRRATDSSRAQLYASHKSNVNRSSEGNKNETPEIPERIVSFDVASSTDEFGHEGPPEETLE